MGFLKTNVHKPVDKLLNCNNTECKPGEFLCRTYKFCISITEVCDGINHGFNNDDELYCGKNFFYFSFLEVKVL